MEKPIKIRITLENINGTDMGTTLYYDFIFFSEEELEKDTWNEFMNDKIKTLFKIENNLPF